MLKVEAIISNYDGHDGLYQGRVYSAETTRDCHVDENIISSWRRRGNVPALVIMELMRHIPDHHELMSNCYADAASLRGPSVVRVYAYVF
jgi:hypothetical protein